MARPTNSWRSYCWFAHNSFGVVQPSGTLKPNDLGFFDSMGNVLEWNQNTFDFDARVRFETGRLVDDIEDALDQSANPSGNPIFRVQRGGSVMNSRYQIYSAARDEYSLMDEEDSYVGFRVACTIAVVPSPAD
ncbi:MAG: SUMF1/EgtB/PvdO family nonheme iron enzyme [Planctomycetota bacterium]